MSASFVGMGSSCSNDVFREPADTPAAGHPTMGITIGFDGATRADGESDGGYQQGVGLENYLDIDSDDYRIYFFTADDADGNTGNRFLYRFKPFAKPKLDENAGASSAYYYYNFFGDVPTDLPLKFKIVFLANWGEYPEEASEYEEGDYALVKGVTTIQDLCTSAKAQFSYLPTPQSQSSDDWLSKNGRLIPFYGVREYDLNKYTPASNIEDGKIKGDIYIDLKEHNSKDTSIPLLRAMAKVEVILDNSFASFESVEINSVMKKGYCAPKDALDYDAYYRDGYTWGKDFIRGVHIPTSEGMEYRLAMTKTCDTDPLRGTKETWVAYIPEFQNITAPATNYIRVTLAQPSDVSDETWATLSNSVDKNGTPVLTKKIYFAPNGIDADDAKYDADGVLSTPGRFDIERNNIYRFTISGMSANLTAQVDVQPYAEKKLEYELGFMRDENGNLMVLEGSKFCYELWTLFKKDPTKRPRCGKYIDNEFVPGKYDDLGNFTATSVLEADTIKLESDLHDYYTIILAPSGSIADSEFRVRDADGCRVISNFSSNVMDDDDEITNDQSCSARLVRDLSLLTPTSYYKDREGYQRVQHNEDHSSIVYNSEKELLFKVVVDVSGEGESSVFETVRCYPVESYTERYKGDDGEYYGGEFWYRIYIQYKEDDPSKVILTFRKGDIKGEPDEDNLLELDKTIEINFDELTDQEKAALPVHPIL